MTDLPTLALLTGIVVQTLGIGIVVFKAARWAGHIDSAFESLTRSVDSLSERFDALEARLLYLERRDQ